MTAIFIDNFPEDLIEDIERLATQNNQTVNEQIITILKEGVKSQKPPLKFLVSPERDPTWEERRKAVPQLLVELERRRKKLPTDIQWLDGTELIREDRDNR